MILKVFTKRTKGGEYINTSREWKEGLFEADNIRKKEEIKRKDCELAECDIFKDGFTFYLINKDDSRQIVLVNTDTQGYEILNDRGICIERYVTPVKVTFHLKGNELKAVLKNTEGDGTMAKDIQDNTTSEQEMVEALRKESDEEILNKCS